MIKPTELERVLSTILEPLGIRALGHDGKVRVSAAGNGLEIRLALPLFQVIVTLDQLEMLQPCRYAEYVYGKLDDGAKQLNHAVVEHIAEHDRSPLDRTKDLEAAATALLDAMGVNLDDVRMPFGSSSAIANAAYRLRELVRQKTGAPAWGPTGYGREPAQVEVVSTP
jgi:hypothetical protein